MIQTNKKRWRKILLISIVAPFLIFGLLLTILTVKQDSIVQQLITTINEDFEGELVIEDSHISPFANFPYISIDLDHVKIFEDKTRSTTPLADIADLYLGFDLWTLMRGKPDIKSLKLSQGTLNLVQHKDGKFNIVNALSSRKEIKDAGEEFHMDIQHIQLDNIDVTKLNEANNVLIEAYILDMTSKFKTSYNHLIVGLRGKFNLNVLVGGDTTYIKHKHFEIKTVFEYFNDQQLLSVLPSEVILEKALFKMDGSIDLDDDMNMDIAFHGNKPNFDLLIAFAPEELIPVLNQYDNAGKIFFEATIKGKASNGNRPLIVADFGCEEAFFANRNSNTRVDDLFFKGHFTNGELRNESTMEFTLSDFRARPQAGSFNGNLRVSNFQSPEIEMKVKSDFDVDFLTKFLNIEGLHDVSGSVALTLNFHDIIDLNNPEKSIERLNESYFTELEVKNLSFRSDYFHLPVRDIDIKATMDGHKAQIDSLNIKVGDSDLQLSATVSDLPAILHHTGDPVSAMLFIRSSLLNIKELTSGDSLRKPVDEQISNMSMKFRFNSSARTFTESPNLPVGEFFIEDLYAKLNYYPHTLHDFHADIYVNDHDFRVIDFAGMIDKSDFHFNGKLNNYDLWFDDDPLGLSNMEFNLVSNLLQLEDLFAYGGENFVPEDYRHEEFRNLKVHGLADLYFNKGLKSYDIRIDHLHALMKVHPMGLENFKGRIHYEDEHLVVEGFSGKLGSSSLQADLKYYLGKDESIRKRDNHLSLKAPRLNFDELFNYTPPPSDSVMTPAAHEAGFNIYDLPFTDMTFDFDISHLNYHRYLIDDFVMKARTQKDHFIYIDTLSMSAAGGKIGLKGYFNGSDRNKIYFSPELKVEKVNLDKLLFKFENFGQDHLVSENLHGQLSGTMTGKVHVHKDLVPIVDDSDIEMEIQVTGGRLERYAALDALSDYFKDKNLSKVLFDTLENNLTLNKGTLTIPKMTIQSSLGFIEISGKQDINLNMEYYLRIPLKLVTQVGMKKLFGKEEVDPDQEDEIQYMDESKRIRFVNIKLTGTPDNYKIGFGRDKK